MSLIHSVRKHLSVLDLLTGLCLVIAAILAVQPHAVLRMAFDNWRAESHMRSQIRQHWGALEPAAVPRYRAAQPPKVIEFADYECPYCRAVEPAVDSAIADGVRIAVIEFPLPIHPHARAAALAAICAKRIGVFESAHEFLMRTDAWQTSPAILATLPAVVPPSDSSRFSRCTSGAGATISLDRAEGLAESLKVPATPTFISEAGVLEGRPTRSALLRFAGQQ